VRRGAARKAVSFESQRETACNTGYATRHIRNLGWRRAIACVANANRGHRDLSSSRASLSGRRVRGAGARFSRDKQSTKMHNGRAHRPRVFGGGGRGGGEQATSFQGRKTINATLQSAVGVGTRGDNLCVSTNGRAQQCISTYLYARVRAIH